MDNFRQQVEYFLKVTGTAASDLSRAATGDPTFVLRMRKGARSWPETQEKVLRYIAKRLDEQ